MLKIINIFQKEGPRIRVNLDMVKFIIFENLAIDKHNAYIFYDDRYIKNSIILRNINDKDRIVLEKYIAPEGQKPTLDDKPALVELTMGDEHPIGKLIEKKEWFPQQRMKREGVKDPSQENQVCDEILPE